MKKMIVMILFLPLFLLVQTEETKAQAVAIKKWKGRYPRMNNNYPQAFISFKGWLPSVPHLFVRVSPTHYYWKVKSIPVTDAKEVSGKVQTGLQRILARMMEKSHFKGRQKETGMIKLLNEFQKQIDQTLFDSRKDQLADIYGLTEAFLQIYDRIDDFKASHGGGKIKKNMKREVNELLEQFLLINLLESDHGKKFQAFTDIRTELIQFFGEVDYSISKVNYYQSFGKQESRSYAFLTQ